tara:strand:- start:53 stop:694 length:642 start_codon:yes stop_codon:yes gene_type:complete
MDRVMSHFDGAKIEKFGWGLDDKIALFSTRFAGRKDRYILMKQDGKIITEHRELTGSVIRDHLMGKARIGVYPVVDGKAKFGAIDLDSIEPDHIDGIATAFRSHGWPFKIAISKSGNVHFFVFSSDWMPTAPFKRAMENIAESSGVPRSKGEKGSPDFRPGIDWGRIYPIDGAIFLPFFDLKNSISNGRNIFVDPKSLQVYDLAGQWRELAQL